MLGRPACARRPLPACPGRRRPLTFHQRLEDDGVQLLGALLLEVIHREQVRVGGNVLQLGQQDTEGGPAGRTRGGGGVAAPRAGPGQERARGFAATGLGPSVGRRRGDLLPGQPHPGMGAAPLTGLGAWGAPTSSVQRTMSSQGKCSPGNFSLHCSSTSRGARRRGWPTTAASTSATPPEPASTSQGVACATAREILWGRRGGARAARQLPGRPGCPVPRPFPLPVPGGEGPGGGPSWPRGTARPPCRPAYLQGAGVTIDQQTEDRDLDAAGACGQRPGEVLPGAWGERGARGPSMG